MKKLDFSSDCFKALNFELTVASLLSVGISYAFIFGNKSKKFVSKANSLIQNFFLSRWLND